MKEKLRNMYEEGLLDTTGLLNAVAKDWITITDVIEIVGEDNALSVVMSAKLSEISNACNAVIVNGVDIKFGEENVHFNLSIEDQSNINNLFRVVELGGTEFPYLSTSKNSSRNYRIKRKGVDYGKEKSTSSFI